MVRNELLIRIPNFNFNVHNELLVQYLTRKILKQNILNQNMKLKVKVSIKIINNNVKIIMISK